MTRVSVPTQLADDRGVIRRTFPAARFDIDAEIPEGFRQRGADQVVIDTQTVPAPKTALTVIPPGEPLFGWFDAGKRVGQASV